MTRLSQAALERAHQERDLLARECHDLINAIAGRTYYLKLLYAARYFLQGLLGYKNPNAPEPVKPPTLTAVQFEQMTRSRIKSA